VILASDEALYLFCLARTDAVSSIDGPGIDVNGSGRPLELIAVRDVVAVVCRVSLEEFCGADAESRMATIGWMAPRACRHEEVIEQVMHRSPVVPAAFSTLFSTPGTLVQWIEGCYLEVDRTLNRFADHDEWSIKVVMATEQAEEQLVQEALAKAPAATTPGARYVMARRVRSQAGSLLESRMAAAYASIFTALQPHCTEHRERPIGSCAEGESREIFAHWAMLLPRDRIDVFRAAAERISEEVAPQGISIDITGPWPPYSFGLTPSSASSL
jgi:Gas vesicle synthesis protein GvpL/GvpF